MAMPKDWQGSLPLTMFFFFFRGLPLNLPAIFTRKPYKLFEYLAKSLKERRKNLKKSQCLLLCLESILQMAEDKPPASAERNATLRMAAILTKYFVLRKDLNLRDLPNIAKSLFLRF